VSWRFSSQSQNLVKGTLMKILTVVGARPQFVKAAVVSRAIAAFDGMEEVLVHTGQHFDQNMSDIFFDQMGIPRPTHVLDINGGTHGAMTGRMMIALEEVMISDKPDMVLVYGDTNSTLAGAINAAKLCIPVAHVEAGLRSFDRTMPEEINRIASDHVSDLLFAPTQLAVRNLAQEGITRGVHHVGDVMFDSTLLMIDAAKASSTIVQDMGLTPGGYALSTLHRQSTTDEPGALAKAVAFLLEQAKQQPVVLPIHPRTRGAAQRLGVSLEGLMIIDPVGPVEMHALLASSCAVFTDSGGLQKEAYFHRKPCVTLRDTTEWVETIDAGWNRLWGEADNHMPRRDIPDYGDGKSSEKIVALLAAHLNGH
jgi:UDP-GlcNAc3NAcA epimerase